MKPTLPQAAVSDDAPPGQAASVPADTKPLEAKSPRNEEEFFKLQLTFNLFPALYAHPSWIHHLERPVTEEKRRSVPANSAFWVRRLSTGLLHARNLDQKFDFDFSDRSKRLALLDMKMLHRLGVLGATVLVRDRMRRIVSGPDVEALRDAVGLDVHRFALRWGGDVPVLPRPVHRIGKQIPDASSWQLRGAILLTSVIPRTSVGILGRLQFKFPLRWMRMRRNLLRLTERERSSLADMFIAIASQEYSDWAWLFEPGMKKEIPC